MKVIDIVELKHSDYQSWFLDIQPSVVALGFFDGVHLGHQTILQTARDIAKKKQLEFAVMTFYPHPKEVIQSHGKPFPYLTPLSRKKDIFAKIGVEKLYIVQFDPAFSQLTPQDFVQQYIVGLRCQHVVAGFDFTYGYKGEGTMKQLTKEGKGLFEVTTIAKIEKHHQKISSTLIREFIVSGQVNILPEYLGDFYEMRGRMNPLSTLHKAHNRLSFIMDVDKDHVLLKPGVYEIRAYVGNRIFEGLCHQPHSNGNVGFLEVQILNCSEDIRNKHIKVKWINRVHNDQKMLDGIQKLH